MVNGQGRGGGGHFRAKARQESVGRGGALECAEMAGSGSGSYARELSLRGTQASIVKGFLRFELQTVGESAARGASSPSRQSEITE